MLLPYPLWGIETLSWRFPTVSSIDYLTPSGRTSLSAKCKVQRERRGYPRPNYALRIANCALPYPLRGTFSKCRVGLAPTEKSQLRKKDSRIELCDCLLLFINFVFNGFGAVVGSPTAKTVTGNARPKLAAGVYHFRLCRKYHIATQYITRHCRISQKGQPKLTFLS